MRRNRSPIADVGDVANLSDAELIRRSWDSPHDFGIIFERHFDAIHAYVLRRTSRHRADELAGETFLAALRHRRDYDLQRADALPWLYGIAGNLLKTAQRTEARSIRLLERAASDLATRNTDSIEEADTRLTVREAVAKLEVDAREVLLLSAWEALSYEEIATALHIPIGTVRSRLHRARNALREAVVDVADSDGTTR